MIGDGLLCSRQLCADSKGGLEGHSRGLFQALGNVRALVPQQRGPRAMRGNLHSTFFFYFLNILIIYVYLCVTVSQNAVCSMLEWKGENIYCVTQVSTCNELQVN